MVHLLDIFLFFQVSVGYPECFISLDTVAK